MAAVEYALRRALIMAALLGPAAMTPPAAAQVGIEIAIPGPSIGIYQPVYPELVLIPGYPVYYAPHARTNYFFYDGYYWVFHDERWYRSAWYDGPWDRVDPYDVPLFVLRVPVRYYVSPPVYFHGWLLAAPPRWDLYWGPRWAQHRHGWNHWDHRAVPRAAPPPGYQRHYSGERYPRPEQQHEPRDRHPPRETTLRRQSAERPAVNAALQPQPALPQRPEASRAQYPQHERHEVRRYAPGPQALQAPAQPRESAAQEQRPLVRTEQRQAPSVAMSAPAVSPAPVMHDHREEFRRPEPAPPQLRATQAFEQRPAARQDPGPRESPQLRVPPGRERESPGSTAHPSRGHGDGGRGLSADRGR